MLIFHHGSVDMGFICVLEAWIEFTPVTKHACEPAFTVCILMSKDLWVFTEPLKSVWVAAGNPSSQHVCSQQSGCFSVSWLLCSCSPVHKLYVTATNSQVTTQLARSTRLHDLVLIRSQAVFTCIIETLSYWLMQFKVLHRWLTNRWKEKCRP